MPKVVIITGCAGGIGRSTLESLLERGHTVYATARRDESVDRLAKELHRFGERCIARRLDVTKPEDRESVIADALNAHGCIDALVNNAGYGEIGAVEDLTGDALRRQFEVNVFGLHELTRRVLPSMRRARSGRIVNVSSVVAHVSTPLMAAYNASKAALNALTNSLRMELCDTGVRVVLVEPGVIRSSFRDNAAANAELHHVMTNSDYKSVYTAWLAMWEKRLAGRVTLPSAVARRIVHAVESPRPKTRYRVTTAAHIAPYAFALLPDALADRIMLRGFGIHRRRPDTV